MGPYLGRPLLPQGVLALRPWKLRILPQAHRSPLVGQESFCRFQTSHEVPESRGKGVWGEGAHFRTRPSGLPLNRVSHLE